MSAGVPTGSLIGRWHRFRYGHLTDDENTGRISRPDNEHLQRGTIAEGLGYRGGTVQRDIVVSSTHREYRRDILYRQRGAL